MEGIQLSVEKTGVEKGISVIKVGGYIDTTTSAELEHALTSLLKSGSFNIIIDLGNVDYVSSAGWGIFISEIKGIREHGGDLKLVRMIPEVYEVFELLEFHFILKAFDSLEDAIRDFEKHGGVTKVSAHFSEPEAAIAEPAKVEKIEKPMEKIETTAPDGRNVPNLSVKEKLREIIKDNPTLGLIGVCRELNTQKYGFAKLGWFKARALLKEMNLDTKKKRMQFFQSALNRRV